MTYEVEQKFSVPDPTGLVAKLNELGATRGERAEQIDTYFAHPSRDFAETDEALRIRQVGSERFITYKGPKIDAETKTRQEIELPLSPYEDTAPAFEALLEALGFSQVATVRKIRTPFATPWNGRTVDVALDDVEGLGTFVELELSAEAAGLDEARQTIIALSSELGFSQSERRSYLELLLD